MIRILALLAVLPFVAHGQETSLAQIKITRSFIDWSDPHGRFRIETVCEKTVSLPVDFTCPSTYRGLPVALAVRGEVEIVDSDEFKLGLPAGTHVLRTFFTLSVNEGIDFPYVQELQALAGYQMFTEDLGLKSQIFQLSPEAQVMVVCGESGCAARGPESVYRANVRVF